jgi:Tol biopolymer transport system component
MKRLTCALALLTVVSAVLVMTTPAQATAPGENGRIAFRRYLNDAHTRGAIVTIRPDGTHQRQLTFPGTREILTNEPDWSPNGRWIVYQVERPDKPRRLYKIRRDGTDRVFLSGGCTSPSSCVGDGFAAWGPGGKRIAFEREMCGFGRNNMLAVFVERANGTHARQVTQRHVACASHRWEDFAPAWAPSGRRLSFERQKRGAEERRAVFTIRLDGTGLRRITPWWLEAAQPDWSPHGAWIAFRTQETCEDCGNIWLVHPDGTGLHAVTHTPAGQGKWLSCSFSPNGHRITAGKSPGFGGAGNADVYTMGLDGSHRRNVTKSSAWESAPDWGPRPT